MLQSHEEQSENRRKEESAPLPIAELYPELSRKEQEQAAYFLNRFLTVMLKIYEENASKKGD